MPTEMPRISIAVPEETVAAITKYQHENMIPNRTQAILRLIEAGFNAIAEGTSVKPFPKFSEGDLRLIRLYNNTDPLYKDVAIKIMSDNQADKKENRA